MGEGRADLLKSWQSGLLPALAAGLGARIWYFLHLRLLPSFDHPLVDSLTYDRLARAVLAGGSGEALFRPPLYHHFLAGIYAFGGEGQAVVAWAQFLLGLAAVIPAYGLAYRWKGPAAAAVTAWIVALYPLRIFFEGEILAVTLFGFLLSLGLWLCWRGFEEGSPRRLFWAGVVFGLAVLTRPNVLIAVPFILAGSLAGPGHPPRRKMTAAAAWLAGIVLAVSPATLYNWRAEGAFIPVAANGGVNFYHGNGPGATGETPLPPGLRWQEAIQQPLREGYTSLADQDRYWWEKSKDYLRADPSRWLVLMARKGLFFWNARESSNNKELGYFAGTSPVTEHYRWWFGVLVCLAAGGFAVRPDGRGNLRILAMLAGYWLSVSLFFVTARYRLPLVPFLAIPAAAFVVELPQLVAGKKRKTPAVLLALSLAGLVVIPPWFGFGKNRIDPDFQMGQVFLMRGEPAKADEHLLAALARGSGGTADIYNSLGATRFALGDLAGAERYYLAALEEGEFAEIYLNLGIVYEGMGPQRLDDALRSYRRCLAINPLEGRAAANLEHILDQTPPGKGS